MNEGQIEMFSSREVAPMQPANDAPFLSVIERIALSPEADINKLERMLEMQERHQRNLAEVAFARAFSEMKPKLPKIVRTKSNTQTNSKYAPIEQINEIVDPVLAQFGFSDRFKIEQTDTHVTAICVLQHRDGHKEETKVTLPLDEAGAKGSINKTRVHAIGSSITYAKRYAKCAALNISTAEDNDGNGPGSNNNAISDYQARCLTDILMECTDTTKQWFMETYGASGNVTKREYTSVLQKLKKARDKAKGGEYASV